MFPPTTRAVGTVAENAVITDPAGDARLRAEAADHYWIQLDAGQGFEDLDPTVPEAAIGRPFAAPLGTFAEVPDELRHKVNVRLKAETVGAFAGPLGLGPQSTTVLDQAFTAVELVGKPLTAGAFVQTTGRSSPIFVTRTTTDSPYLAVGEFDDSWDQLQLIRGQDFQEMLTNFSLASRALTGVFLEVAVSGPGGPTETFERALADRVGFAVRSVSGDGGLSLGPDAPPLLSDLDVVKLFAAPGLGPPRPGRLAAVMDRLAEDFRRAIEPDLPEEQGSELLKLPTRELMDALTRALGTTYLVLSDAMTRQLSGTALVKAYADRPRLIPVSTRFRPEPERDGGRVTIGIDLRRDALRDAAGRLAGGGDADRRQPGVAGRVLRLPGRPLRGPRPNRAHPRRDANRRPGQLLEHRRPLDGPG
jgi:hypothetical protein